jgi:hypothetical protein
VFESVKSCLLTLPMMRPVTGSYGSTTACGCTQRTTSGGVAVCTPTKHAEITRSRRCADHWPGQPRVVASPLTWMMRSIPSFSCRTENWNQRSGCRRWEVAAGTSSCSRPSLDVAPTAGVTGPDDPIRPCVLCRRLAVNLPCLGIATYIEPDQRSLYKFFARTFR